MSVSDLAIRRRVSVASAANASSNKSAFRRFDVVKSTRRASYPYSHCCSHRCARRRKPRIVIGDALNVGLEGFQVLDLETDMVHAGGNDAGAVIIGDVPRHDDERHVTVGEIMVGIARFLADIARRELEHVAADCDAGDRQYCEQYLNILML